MMRSMFSGVSGLRAHQTRMDVIGNNVANVNTVGFKSGRVTFQEVFSQTLRGAGAPDSSTGRGGMNPMQVGLGISVGSVDTIMVRGSLQRTDNPTDLSIEGDGFFIVKGGSSDTYRFTRAGNFGIDKLGNLVTANGMNVQGWQSYQQNRDGSYVFSTEDQVEAINLYYDDVNKDKRIIPAKATTTAVFAGNLDAGATALGSSTAVNTSSPQFTTPVTVYDTLGNEYKVKVNFWKISASGVSASAGSGANGHTSWYWSVDGGAGTTSSSANGMIQFNSKGQIIRGSSSYNIEPSISIIPDAARGTEPINVKLDFNKISMYARDSSVKPANVDGYTSGNLITFNIGPDGIITGIYSNGEQKPLGMLALASFENPAGLQKVGENLYIPTTNSGNYEKGQKAGSQGIGNLSPGTLEMSNVDLSREFTDMIITQRGFQANSRIITTSDEMLQELVNLKR